MNTIIFMISCLLFLFVCVGLPIIGVAYLIIKFVCDRQLKQYLEFREKLDELDKKNHLHHTW